MKLYMRTYEVSQPTYQIRAKRLLGWLRIGLWAIVWMFVLFILWSMMFDYSKPLIDILIP